MDSDLLTPSCIDFLELLHREFGGQIKTLLQKRQERKKRIKKGELPQFLEETKAIREDASWRISPLPKRLEKRWVEITGPTDKKLIVNALNADVDGFMADFEDANVPFFENMINGQKHLRQAIEGTLAFTSNGKDYKVACDKVTLHMRPRGLHLSERGFQVNQQAIAGSLFDLGVYLYHNIESLIKRQGGAFIYLPKIENRKEAALFTDLFSFIEETLGSKKGSIRSTILIEHILAAFEIDEILFATKEHITALNAGRWDYIFSFIKTFSHHPCFLFPDRDKITMEAPFLQAYQKRIIQKTHPRGALAIGGMSAFIPDKADPSITKKALKKVCQDKEMEARLGFDGCWIAHPFLAEPVREVFQKELQGAPNQMDKKIPSKTITEEELLNVAIDSAKTTLKGIEENIEISLIYLNFWLLGRGAVSIHHLMEDAATLEISRSQLYQWLRHSIEVEGQPLTKEKMESLFESVKEKLRKQGDFPKLDDALSLLQKSTFSEEIPDFMTLLAIDQ